MLIGSTILMVALALAVIIGDAYLLRICTAPVGVFIFFFGDTYKG